MYNLRLAISFILLSFYGLTQISGTVIDAETKETLIGVKLFASDGAKAQTDFDGKFKLSSTTFPVEIKVSFIQYDDLILTVNGPTNELAIELKETVSSLETVVVSANRRKQAVEEIPISLEVIRPELVDNKGLNNLQEAVGQSPGVFTMDGQVSIRGGSGFAYGAGSRVLILWNGMPLLSGYAGDTQWEAIPMEQASQIEIMKGAASVLYGSGALNGVIALSQREPSPKRETKFKVQAGVYDNPNRSSLQWWDTNPTFQQVEAYTAKSNEKIGYTISTQLYHDEGFKEGGQDQRARVSGQLYFRNPKRKRLKYGVGYNYQIAKRGVFLIWDDAENGYSPSGGADTSDAESTLNISLGNRLFIDPYLKYIDKKDNVHQLKNRAYLATNNILNNADQSNGALVNFTEYQYQRQLASGATWTAGAANTYNIVTSQLFGDHNSLNAAAYGQYEKKIGKFDFTAGMRLEYFEMNGMRGDSDYFLPTKDSISIPVSPVFRTGIHYKAAKYTHFRASFGQGIRYPSVAERYTQTNVGALNIFPNQALTPERGWAAEIGVKQGVKIGNWKGMIDVSGFVNEYDNMIEFTFGLYNPDTLPLSTNPANPGYINNWIGFQAQNAEKARIAGVEFSFNSTGSIGEFEIVSLIGYTYMNPISLNSNEEYLNTFSDTTTNMLKYRFRHLAKADIEVNYKKFSAGISYRYNSFMRNIDIQFEDAIAGSTYILPGLKEYRQEFNRGNNVVDFRVGYKFSDKWRLGFIINNILNEEYTSRPGDIRAPRNFILQLQVKL